MKIKDLQQTLMQGGWHQQSPTAFTPTRATGPFPPAIVNSQLPIFQAPRTSTAIKPGFSNSTGNFSIPAAVIDPAVTISTSSTVDNFTVTFLRDGFDQYFASVNIYLLYAGSLSDPVLAASGNDSPIKFSIANPSTGSNVSVYVQAVNAVGQGLPVTSCPSVPVTL